MVYFPVTRADGKGGKFLQVVYTERELPNVQYVKFGPDGPRGGRMGVAIDERIMAHKDSMAAVCDACAASYRTGGFLSVVGLRGGENLTGASLGLATAVELYAPGMFSDVAFTGYITDFSNSAISYGIKDVDNVKLKVEMARRAGMILIVPPSDWVKVEKKRYGIVTAKDISSENPRSLTSMIIGSAETLLEATVVANTLRYLSRN